MAQSKKRKRIRPGVVLDRDGLRVILGESLRTLRKMDACSVDAVVTDPPYDLTAISRGGSQRTNDPKTPFGRHRLQSRDETDEETNETAEPSGAKKTRGEKARAKKAKSRGGFMGKRWDATGIAFKKEFWREVLRVLKPGGHLLAFGGTRTYHRMVCAIEDAGFEVRDCIDYLYGSGFPKSLDVSKAIDKMSGTEREVVGVKPGHENFAGRGTSSVQSLRDGTLGQDGGFARPWMDDPEKVARYHMQTAAATLEARRWSGFGTALKPSHEPIVLARKPLDGTVAHNVLKHGTGAIDVGRCRVVSGADHREKCESVVGLDSNRNGVAYGEWRGERESSWSPAGRWPPNVVLVHSEKCRRVGERRVSTGTAYESEHEEVVSAYECASNCPARLLDEQSGEARSAYPNNADAAERYAGSRVVPGPFGGDRAGLSYSDSGGASRFFPTFEWSPLDDLSDVAPFFYTAKAATSERNDGIEDGRNNHPTVKPIALIRWLVRLVTPPGGTVLDPFLGSGTTLLAAKLEDRRAIGIEREPEYVAIVEARVGHATKQAPLFEVGVLGGSVDRPPAPIAEVPARAERRVEERGRGEKTPAAARQASLFGDLGEKDGEAPR